MILLSDRFAVVSFDAQASAGCLQTAECPRSRRGGCGDAPAVSDRRHSGIQRSRRIGATLEHVLAYFNARLWHGDVIVVLDGGGDGTGDEVRRVSGTDPRVVVLDNEVNRGKGFSVRRGMLAATGDYVLFCDADLSTPIEEASRLIAAIDDGAHVAIASRALADSNFRVHQPWWRESMGRVFKWFVQWLALPGIQDSQCGFSAFDAKGPIASSRFSASKVSPSTSRSCQLREVSATALPRSPSRGPTSQPVP